MMHNFRTLGVALAVFALTTVSLAFPTRAMASCGGEVLPANAKPKGVSLSNAALATAYYNTGGATAPKEPFAILTGDTTLKPGTMLYVPVFEADSNTDIGEPFPSLHDQDANADYLIDAVNDFIHQIPPLADVNVEALFIQVDDQAATILGDDYVAGVTTPLADGPGKGYIVSAVFLTPLTPGHHTISIGGVVDGQPSLVAASYSVTIQPK